MKMNRAACFNLECADLSALLLNFRILQEVLLALPNTLITECPSTGRTLRFTASIPLEPSWLRRPPSTRSISSAARRD